MKSVLLNIWKVKESIFISVIFSFLSYLLIFYFSSKKEFWSILNSGLNYKGILLAIWDYISIISVSVNPIIFITYIIFILVLFVYFLTFFAVIFIKYKNNKIAKNIIPKKDGLLGFVSSFFFIIGFGCVSCGHTLILSVISLFTSTYGINLAYSVSFIFIFLSILLLLFSIYKQIKILKNPYVCDF